MAPRIFTIQEEHGPPSYSSTTTRHEGRDDTPQAPGKRRRVSMVTHEELLCPPIAWPTIFLFLACLITFFLPVFLTWNNPTLWTVPISILAMYVMFTPMHEAAHRTVSTKHKWLNHLVGYVSAIVVFQAPFRPFRYIHLEHHKHTNDPVKDPDHWSAGFGPWWIQPLFWSTQTCYYYYLYLSRLFTRPFDEVVEAISGIGLNLLLMWSAYHYKFGQQFLHFILLPRTVADTFLAYSFDYAPHHPHHVTRETDIYACTSMIAGLLDPSEGIDLSLPLLYQNYHNIHHLYPTIPFYRYSLIWRNHQKELSALGTPIGSWFGLWRTEQKKMA